MNIGLAYFLCLQCLGTCYRLPKDIYEASSMLLDQEEECIAKSYDISPAAAKKLVSSVEIGRDSDSTSFPIKKDSRLGESLLLSKGLQKLDSTVLIHGLWDSREEYKYIASTIRRRSKERRKAFISAMNEVDSNLISDEDQLDVTDVAVMVRSSSQIDLLKETLTAYGIPFIVAGENIDSINDEKEHMPLLARTQNKAMRCIPMKPAMVMTMHRSKGEEFDDVYLTGWSEGSFPHPDAVSSNLVHEERRLGYGKFEPFSVSLIHNLGVCLTKPFLTCYFLFSGFDESTAESCDYTFSYEPNTALLQRRQQKICHLPSST